MQSTTVPATTADIDLSLLPSTALDHQPEALPSGVALYLAITPSLQVLYIGTTPNLMDTWKESLGSLGRLNELPDIRVAWIEVSSPELLPSIEALFISHLQPALNGWHSKLKDITELNIDGWYDFQNVNGVLYAFYINSVMPVPCPMVIAKEYRQAIRDNARALGQLEHVLKINQSATTIDQLRQQIQSLHKEISFIAPAGCYVCSYIVKRPYAHYQYEKLMSPDVAIFPSRSQRNAGKLVKNLHLGRTGSEKHQAALAGIQARKQIARWERQIEVIEEIAAWQASQSSAPF